MLNDYIPFVIFLSFLMIVLGLSFESCDRATEGQAAREMFCTETHVPGYHDCMINGVRCISDRRGIDCNFNADGY